MRFKKSLIALLVMCLASGAWAQFSQIGGGWPTVGGMTFSYVAEPVSPAYAWPWGDNNINPTPGVVSYGGFWDGGSFDFYENGGTHAGQMSVSNTIDSYDAYITQTMLLPQGSLDYLHGGSHGPGLLGQQFVQFVDPGIGTGQTGIWVDLDYGNGEVDSGTMNSSSNWQWTTVNLDPATPMYQVTIRIGILKDPGVTTGTRTLWLEDFLLWGWSLPLNTGGVPPAVYAQWDNFDFDVPEPATMALLVFGGLALLRRRRS